MQAIAASPLMRLVFGKKAALCVSFSEKNKKSPISKIKNTELQNKNNEVNKLPRFGAKNGKFSIGGSAHRTWDFVIIIAAVVLVTCIMFSIFDTSGKILSAGFIGFFSLLAVALIIFFGWQSHGQKI